MADDLRVELARGNPKRPRGRHSLQANAEGLRVPELLEHQPVPARRRADNRRLHPSGGHTAHSG